MGAGKITVVGVTGNMGSGKSYLCKTFLEDYGVPVFYCDVELKKIINKNVFVISEIKRLIGEDAYIKDGKGGEVSNSKKIADIIFSDNDLKYKIELLTIGPLLNKFYDFVYFNHDLDVSSFVLIESAIMIETGFFKIMDEIIYVHCDQDKRIEHLVKDRGFGEQEIKMRLRTQKDFKNHLKIINSYKIPHVLFKNDFKRQSVVEFSKTFYNQKLFKNIL